MKRLCACLYIVKVNLPDDTLLVERTQFSEQMVDLQMQIGLANIQDIISLAFSLVFSLKPFSISVQLAEYLHACLITAVSDIKPNYGK